MTSETSAVIAGLVLGIALIVIFASYVKPAFTMSDDEVRDKVRSLPEVQAFYERYTPLEQIGRDGTATYVYYQIGRTWQFDYGEHSKALWLTVRIDPYGRTSMILECLGPISVGMRATVDEIRKTECVEKP